MVWFLVGYMWLFIHRPFVVWPWLGDLHIERVYMLATIGYWALIAPKTWTSNRVTWGIGFLASAIILATLFSPYTGFDNVKIQDWFKILLFYFLVLSSVREERELRIIIVAFVAIMGIYELHSFREYLCGKGESRMGIWRMIGVERTDPNGFATSANLGLTMLLPALALARRKWHYVALAAAAALACLCVLLTGSRTGFAGLALLAVGAALISKYRWRLVLLALLGVPLVWFSLSARLQNRYLTLIDPSLGPKNAQASADSREVFFWIGVEIWKKHPVFGVGPGCFAIVAGTELQAHSLYGQTISELGTVGVIALVALIVCYLWNYFEARRVYRAIPPPNDALFCYRVVAATAVTLLQLLFFGLGGHNLFRFVWIWYAAFAALALGFLKAQYENAAWNSCSEESLDAQAAAEVAAEC